MKGPATLAHADAGAACRLTPVIQVVATALAASRQTLNRLTAERTELDSLIVKEEKQVRGGSMQAHLS